MKAQLGWRYWLETGVAAASASLAVLTLFWRDWIEAIFHVDPDHGSGSAEWIAVAILAAIAVTAALLARAERHRVAVTA
jgi:hypothetical protein